jgi:hypothetical protein
MYNYMKYKEKNTMTSTIQIEQMSREEKIRTMEAIWVDLSNSEVELESPAWHEVALNETKARFIANQEEIMDWKTAKHELRKLFE